MLRSKRAVAAALEMARDEMNTVEALDADTLRENREKIFVYYAAKDDWVGDEKTAVLEVLGRSDERTYDDPGDTPHSFCVTREHSQRVADRCSRWLTVLTVRGSVM